MEILKNGHLPDSSAPPPPPENGMPKDSVTCCICNRNSGNSSKKLFSPKNNFEDSLLIECFELSESRSGSVSPGCERNLNRFRTDNSERYGYTVYSSGSTLQERNCPTTRNAFALSYQRNVGSEKVLKFSFR